jgi:hypothetical protein
MKRLILVALFSLVMSGYIQSVKAAPLDPENPWRNYYFELSFGNSILFMDQGYQDNSSGEVKHNTLPVSSYLFTAEWRATERFSVAAAWNLPFTTVKRIKGTSVTEKYVAPSYGGGLTFSVYTFKVSDITAIEPEIGILLFRTYKSVSKDGDFFFPIGFFKLNIARDSGMNIYIGVTQAPAKNTTALVYGIGQRF